METVESGNSGDRGAAKKNEMLWLWEMVNVAMCRQ